MRVQTFILRPLVIHNKLTNSKITNHILPIHREFKIKPLSFFSTKMLNKIELNLTKQDEIFIYINIFFCYL